MHYVYKNIRMVNEMIKKMKIILVVILILSLSNSLGLMNPIKSEFSNKMGLTNINKTLSQFEKLNKTLGN